MKQYYQFMLREVLDDFQKLDCYIDAFEEDLHKMLMVSVFAQFIYLFLNLKEPVTFEAVVVVRIFFFFNYSSHLLINE